MYKLGDMFSFGNHVDKNADAAFFWYMEAFRHGQKDKEVAPNIKYRLGRCFLHGYGTEKNIMSALVLLQEAEIEFFKLIEENDPFAKFTLPKVKKELENARAMMYHAVGLD